MRLAPSLVVAGLLSLSSILLFGAYTFLLVLPSKWSFSHPHDTNTDINNSTQTTLFQASVWSNDSQHVADSILGSIARTRSEFDFQLAYMNALRNDDQKFTDDELSLILRTTTAGMMLLSSYTRKSGNYLMEHGIGSASCALQAGLGAVEVSALLVHFLYTLNFRGQHTLEGDSQPSSTNPFSKRNLFSSECEYRRFMAELFTPEVEEAVMINNLWLDGFESERWSLFPGWIRRGYWREEFNHYAILNMCDYADFLVHGENLWGHGIHNNEENGISINQTQRKIQLEFSTMVGGGELLPRLVKRSMDSSPRLEHVGEPFLNEIQRLRKLKGPVHRYEGLTPGTDFFKLHFPWLKSLIEAARLDSMVEPPFTRYDKIAARIKSHCQEELRDVEPLPLSSFWQN